jgi:hypothetical protein
VDPVIQSLREIAIEVLAIMGPEANALKLKELGSVEGKGRLSTP